LFVQFIIKYLQFIKSLKLITIKDVSVKLLNDFNFPISISIKQFKKREATCTDKSSMDAVLQQHHEHICTCSAVVASRHPRQQN